MEFAGERHVPSDRRLRAWGFVALPLAEQGPAGTGRAGAIEILAREEPCPRGE